MLVAALGIAACGREAAPDRVVATIGFIFIGAHDDLGYNQAAWEGSEAVARAFPEIQVLRVEGVPETSAAVDALEGLISEGASVVFATSFGHRDFAYEVAERHPDVVVFHQGGVEPSPRLDNFGTYWGNVYEPVFQAGIAAGAATTTDIVGFVAAFPIPATFANVNAFTLGARSVNPDVVTSVRFTGDWCDPVLQAEFAADLLAAGADVLSQHQDCTRTILEAAEAAGAMSVGYHVDGSEVAVNGWLAGAVWTWGDTFTDMVRRSVDGTFVSSPYNGDFRGRLATGDNPFVITPFGPSVTSETAALMDAAGERFRGGATPFDGPIVDRDGTVRVPAGTAPDQAEVDAMDYFVAGVIGDVPE